MHASTAGITSKPSGSLTEDVIKIRRFIHPPYQGDLGVRASCVRDILPSLTDTERSQLLRSLFEQPIAVSNAERPDFVSLLAPVLKVLDRQLLVERLTAESTNDASPGGQSGLRLQPAKSLSRIRSRWMIALAMERAAIELPPQIAAAEWKKVADMLDARIKEASKAARPTTVPVATSTQPSNLQSLVRQYWDVRGAPAFASGQRGRIIHNLKCVAADLSPAKAVDQIAELFILLEQNGNKGHRGGNQNNELASGLMAAIAARLPLLDEPDSQRLLPRLISWYRNIGDSSGLSKCISALPANVDSFLSRVLDCSDPELARAYVQASAQLISELDLDNAVHICNKIEEACRNYRVSHSVFVPIVWPPLAARINTLLEQEGAARTNVTKCASLIEFAFLIEFNFLCNEEREESGNRENSRACNVIRRQITGPWAELATRYLQYCIGRAPYLESLFDLAVEESRKLPIHLAADLLGKLVEIREVDPSGLESALAEVSARERVKKVLTERSWTTRSGIPSLVDRNFETAPRSEDVRFLVRLSALGGDIESAQVLSELLLRMEAKTRRQVANQALSEFGAIRPDIVRGPSKNPTGNKWAAYLNCGILLRYASETEARCRQLAQEVLNGSGKIDENALYFLSAISPRLTAEDRKKIREKVDPGIEADAFFSILADDLVAATETQPIEAAKRRLKSFLKNPTSASAYTTMSAAIQLASEGRNIDALELVSCIAAHYSLDGSGREQLLASATRAYKQRMETELNAPPPHSGKLLGELLSLIVVARSEPERFGVRLLEPSVSNASINLITLAAQLPEVEFRSFIDDLALCYKNRGNIFGGKMQKAFEIFARNIRGALSDEHRLEYLHSKVLS